MEGLFTRVCSTSFRGSAFEGEKGRLDIGKKFFTLRVLENWNRFLR